jgi:peptidoglycan/LPS O-acetylase OafA/YrhL
VTHHTASPAPAQAAAPPPTNARIDGLDGIRALAVIGVILYHTDLDWSPAAGFLGVDVFFTLSGFLITALLLREHRAAGRIDVAQFYLRRARRLLPALWMLLLFVVIAGLTISRDTVAGLRGDVPAALLYVSNWWQIYHGQSYFELIGRPAPLQHLWSLSIEEQFYLLWPALVIGLLARGGERLVGRASLALAGLITAWMWILAIRHGYPADTDPSRGYFGLDSHSMGLFAGAALAAAWNPWRDAPLATRRTTEWMGWLALAALIITFFRVTETTSFLYRGGFLLVAALTCALIYAVVDRRTMLGRLFSLAPLRWIGERSYGLYLWHWPVFGLLRPGLDVHLGEGACLVLRLGATFAIAELCYRYVERPIRTGRFANWPEAQRQQYRLGAVAMGTGAIALGLLLYLQPARRGGLPDDVAAAIGNGVARHAGHAPTAPAHAGDAGHGKATHDPATRARTAAAERDDGDGDDDIGDVLAIGDSVILGASHVLGRTIDGLQIDAAVGRQARDIVERIRELKAANQIAPRVILHLGTNGYVTEPQMRTILDALADRDEVVLINANAPRRWVDVNNELFRQLAATHPNVTVFDWHGASVEHPEYFVSDRVHLSTAGLKVFTSELRRIGHFTPPETAAQRLARSDAEVRGIVVGSASAEVQHRAPVEPRPMEEATPEPGIAPVSDVVYAAETPVESEVTHPVGPPLQLNAKPIAVDAYWDKVAACESESNWTRRGSNGGLGIRTRAWLAYGGGEFARTAGGATREQQIVVANRISTQGYPRSRAAPLAAVGFGGFGCAHRVGRPVLILHTAESVLAQGFQWGQTGGTVEELQAVLDVPRSGHYDAPTWRAHLKVLASHEFPRSLAPDSPLAYASGHSGR